MILCVTPNTAIDKTLVVENFALNAIHRPSLELNLPGGRAVTWPGWREHSASRRL